MIKNKIQCFKSFSDKVRLQDKSPQNTESALNLFILTLEEIDNQFF